MRIITGIMAVLCLLGCCTGMACAEENAVVTIADNPEHAVMRPDWDTLITWKADYEKAPLAYR